MRQVFTVTERVYTYDNYGAFRCMPGWRSHVYARLALSGVCQTALSGVCQSGALKCMPDRRFKCMPDWRSQVYARLVGGHKGAVTQLLPLGAVAPGGAERLLSAAADGTIAVWEPSTTSGSVDGRHFDWLL